MTYQVEEILLKVDDVNLTYDKPILRNVSFQINNIIRKNIHQGQVISLLGRSGIGKTQLFKIISGLIKPSSGNVFIGSDLHPIVAGEVGIVHQNYILFNHRTIYDNLKIGLSRNTEIKSEKEAKDLINQYAENFNLSEHLKKYPQQLSGGQKQRASIIQQILSGNKYILLDEPFSGLDVIMIDKVVDILRKISLMHEHNTMIIVSHDISSALSVSDSAFILANEENKAGATITQTINLAEMGLAWQDDIIQNKSFQELVRDVKSKL